MLRENRNTHQGFTESWEALCKRKHEPPFSGIMLVANGHEREGHSGRGVHHRLRIGGILKCHIQGNLRSSCR